MLTENRKNLSLVLTALAVTLLISGCGKAQDVSLPSSSTSVTTSTAVGTVAGSVGPGGVVCGTGSYSFINANCLTDFVTACSQVGVVVSTGSSQTCSIPLNTPVLSSQMGILNPSDTNGSLAGTGIVVRAGDILTFSGAGSWGTSKSSGNSFFTWTSYSCNKVNLNGVNGGTTTTYQGYPAGLIGAVAGSNEVFFVGSNLANHAISNAGILHLGVNAPVDSSLCGGFSGVLLVTVH